MSNPKIILAALAGIVVLSAATASSYAATSDTTDVVKREASEGPRGGDNERPGDRQRRGGRTGALENPADYFDVARRGADDAPGTERPGDNHRQRRGGRLSTENPSDFVIAREASEGPRGGDNERPGDRQRRGGRRA